MQHRTRFPLALVDWPWSGRPNGGAGDAPGRTRRPATPGHLSVANPNAGVKAAGVILGMLAGADSIDDLGCCATADDQGVRCEVKAPSTSTFLRSFTFGHVRQLDAVHSRTPWPGSPRSPALVGEDGRDGVPRRRRHDP